MSGQHATNLDCHPFPGVHACRPQLDRTAAPGTSTFPKPGAPDGRSKGLRGLARDSSSGGPRSPKGSLTSG